MLTNLLYEEVIGGIVERPEAVIYVSGTPEEPLTLFNIPLLHFILTGKIEKKRTWQNRKIIII